MAELGKKREELIVEEEVDTGKEVETKLEDEELEDVVNEEESGKEEDGDLFTQEDVNKIIESRLARERKKFSERVTEEAEKLLDKKLDERQRVSELSEEERKQEEQDERERELAERESRLAFKERFADTQETLSERKLSPEFASFLIKDTEEETFENIKVFQKLFETKIAEGVKDELRGKTPKAGTGKTNVLTKEQFDKLTYTERVKLRREDEALYNRLTGDIK